MLSDLTYNPIPFDHTYLLYDPSDLISVASVYLSLLPIGILCFYLSWFLITREIEPVIVVGGQLTSEVINGIVKKLIKQPRPDFHKSFGGTSSSLGYGMPSAHSQFMGFFAAYFCLTLAFRINSLPRAQKVAGYVSLILSAVMVAFSRVYLLYHTVNQVLLGVSIGFNIGIAYFIVISIAREVGFIEWIITWPILSWFFIKDSYYHCYTTFEEDYNSYSSKKQIIETLKSKKNS